MRDAYLHHSGGIGSDQYASSAHLTAASINRAHKARWNFKSSLNFYGGYTEIYDPKTRKFTQHRALGEPTAAQRGFNDQYSLGIIGNYSRSRMGSPHGSVDPLTQQTRDDVAEHLFGLINGQHGLKVVPGTVLDFSLSRIWPHRKVSNTSCYGSFLNDGVFKGDLTKLYSKKIGVFTKLLQLILSLLALMQTREAVLGSEDDRECEGSIMM